MKTSLNKTLLSAALSSLTFSTLPAHAAYTSESAVTQLVSHLTAETSFTDLVQQGSISDALFSSSRPHGAAVVAPAYMPILPILPAVPEPQTYALLLAGLAAGGFIARRRKFD